jgi:glycosyltransferase involved in cell wall biosynthesis
MTGSKPRLLFIGASPPPHHGVSTANAILLQSPTLRARYDVRHLDLSDHRPISTVEQFDARNVLEALKHGTLAGWHLLAGWPQLVYVQISQKPLGFLRDALFLVPARLLARRVVVHLHGGNFHAFYRAAGPLLAALIRFCLVRVRVAVVLGDALRGCFENLVPAERIAVVPNGIPDLRAEQSRPTPGPRFRALYLGTVVREKGCEVFIRAALRVLEKTDDVEFVVAGPWYRAHERDELLALVKQHRREANIRFLGEVAGPQKSAALLGANVFVFPGLQQEGLPLVVLEALCAGIPVIASDRGCLREVISDGVNGFIVPPGDLEAVADRILQLRSDPTLAARMGAAARARYEAAYRDDVYVARMLTVFEQALTPAIR